MSDPATQLAALYAAYQGRVFGLLYHLTGNADDAADLTHETFIRAFKALAYTTPDERVLFWLHAIARNCARDYLRRRARFTWLVYDPARDTRTAAPPPRSAADLWARLAPLPRDYRRVLLLTAAEVPTATQCRVLGRSEGAVKGLRFRARRAARARLAGE